MSETPNTKAKGTGTEEEAAAGGPAFPTDYHAECPQCKTEIWGATSHGGMTLLDYFAAKALPAIQAGALQMVVTAGQNIPHEAQAAGAYHLAQAMLVERDKHRMRSMMNAKNAENPK
jgi:hypothetical protein